MDMTGERRIAAPRETVWAALNDTEVLRTSIPGCDTLVREADNVLRATASIKIGPISAKFGGKVNLLDLDPPNSYRIDGEGIHLGAMLADQEGLLGGRPTHKLAEGAHQAPAA